MLDLATAQQQVLEQARARTAILIGAVGALGLRLAEDIFCDLDSPPYNKSLVDGYAVTEADVTGVPHDLEIIAEVPAGQLPNFTLQPGQTARIMTGAPLPAGADRVVMHEHTERTSTDGLGRLRLLPVAASTGRHWLAAGASMRTGELVLKQGHELRPVDIGLLAEVGRTTVHAVPRATVAILATGDELVPAMSKPGPGQIRNSNGTLLEACTARTGNIPRQYGIVPDSPQELQRYINNALSADVVLLSGGVSAGDRDFVPAVLKELGVTEVFHGIRLKPGKPLWFGYREHNGHRTLVFGLPGNPVSTLVGFELLVRPALRVLAGAPPMLPQLVTVKLATEFTHRSHDRPTFHPAEFEPTADGILATPLSWQGSPDLRGVSRACGLIQFPAGEKTYAAGDSLEALPL